MIYEDSKENLLKQGLIKKCPLDLKAVNNLIKRAYTDLKTAERNITDDKECAYNYAYKGIGVKPIKTDDRYWILDKR